MAGRKKNRRATLCLVISPAENSSAIDNYRTRERVSSFCCLLDQRSLTIFLLFLPLFSQMKPVSCFWVTWHWIPPPTQMTAIKWFVAVVASAALAHLTPLFSCFQGPPSPCDVEFENAYIVPEGKSSIRTRPKEVKVSFLFTQPPVWENAQLSTWPAPVK